MLQPSDYPRTFSASFCVNHEHDARPGIFVEAAFAVQLEKELNATNAELERTREQLRVAREAIKALLDAEDPRIDHDEFVEVYGFSQQFCNENALNALAQSNPDKEEPNVPLE